MCTHLGCPIGKQHILLGTLKIMLPNQDTNKIKLHTDFECLKPLIVQRFEVPLKWLGLKFDISSVYVFSETEAKYVVKRPIDN